MKQLIKRTALLFSSVGDVSQSFTSWNGQERAYDIALAYYGNSSARAAELKNSCDFFLQRKAVKFSNLAYWCALHPEMLDKYDYIFVPDDDITMTPEEIQRLLAMAKEGGYPVCSPAHSSDGRISWSHMRAEPEGGIVFTNFVEMTCPLFEITALKRFLAAFQKYADFVSGTGTDFIISSACGGPDRPFAVLHDIVVTNPTTVSKGLRRREMDEVHSDSKRWSIWGSISREFPFYPDNKVKFWRPE
ncbi:MAG: DUF707 domain-containing protein [Puniceicoccales bacterium]|jgi:hypothetical protein|nr:DUF707 domain-containing protein [Puniceicoccales bacterium]